MNTKLSAIIMASVMLVVAFAAALTPSAESDAAIGTIDNPQYIIGTENVAYVISGETGSVSAVVSMNAKAFDIPDFDFEAYYTADAEMVDTDGEPAGVLETENFDIDGSDATGVFTLTFTKDGTVPFKSGYYLIKVTLEDTVGGNFNDVTLNYYYAAHISTTAADVSVVLVDADGDELVETVNNVEQKKTLVFNKDTDYTGTFAKVKIGTGDDAVYLGIEEYDFYESNLPYGIDMKSDGEIAGKIISSAELTEEDQPFTVYAINKNTGKTILSGEYKYAVEDSLNPNYFKYKIGEDDEAKLYSVVGYSAIKNTDSLTVTILDINGEPIEEDDVGMFSAAYSAGGSALTPITGLALDDDDQLTVTLPAMDDYTGIVQLQITKTVGGNTYTAVIHVMLVGPLVHSGLEPTVTSA